MSRKTPRPLPTGTYRVQLTPDNNFASLGELADHLALLGVSHAYLSPILQPTPGSLHGYDVVDHAVINRELGGEQGFLAAAAILRESGVEILLDVVPNHMALTTPEFLNDALWGALKDGPDSTYARWFDVDWSQQLPLLMPILGKRIDECLDDGDITIDLTGGPRGEAVLRYYEHVLPIRTGTQDLPLLELLGDQHYRLAYWRVADEELNYRRFFDVDTLLAIRVEDPEVFEATHRVPVQLVGAGLVSGLRIDHPDGLTDPSAYLSQLAKVTDGAWVVAEKILVGDEELPADWQCDGTTGYEALRRIGALFVDPGGEPVLRGAFAEFTGVTDDWDSTVERARRDVVRGLLVAEVDRLASVAHEICAHEVRLRDHSLRGLTEAVYELLVALPVYRAYVTPGEAAPNQTIAMMEVASEQALSRRPERAAEVRLVVEMALGRLGRGSRKDEFCLRFQQTSGPAIAKGVEDTASYRWFPESGLNEVGGEPATFGIASDEFHGWAQRRQELWPFGLTAASTHDTKRSEDVRARLAVISEIPGEWATTARAWRDAIGPMSAGVASTEGRMPQENVVDSGQQSRLEQQQYELDDRLDWLAWQTLVGAWPISAARLTEYLLKAAREGKLLTSWTSPDEAVEQRIAAFVERVFVDDGVMASVAQVVERLHPGFLVNVLGQRAVQLFLPGIPDIYQGCEVVNLRLVDADNRTPVNPSWVRQALDRGLAGPVDPNTDLDGAKARLTALGLQLRRDRPELVGPEAHHIGLQASGEAADHVVGFQRGSDLVVLVSRFALRLAAGGGWRDTAVVVPAGRWRSLLSDRVLSVGGEACLVEDLFGDWPVVVLVRQQE
jgi:(1->4)-alpha-D-glucan 1-alpha-D-glucosylmutase